MSSADVKYQGGAQRLLQRAMHRARMPHAYVFHGPDGVGKEMLALGLAETLLCRRPIERTFDGHEQQQIGVERLRVGCGTCDDCRATVAQIHPDLHIIYRQLSRQHPDAAVRSRKALEIGVDVLRHFVIEKVGLTPALGRAKVFVIREADRMTTAAQNALLKTLEEPPPSTIIILLVSAVDRLLPTTLSRCQVVPFDALPTSFVQEKLAASMPDLPKPQLDWYARLAEGSIGQAIQHAEDGLYELSSRLLDGLAQPDHLRSHILAKSWMDESKALGERYRKRDPEITDTEADRRGLTVLFHLAAAWYADLLRAGTGTGPALLNHHHAAQIEHAAQSIDHAHAAEAITRIARAERQLDLNANTQLCVETLLNDLIHISVDKIQYVL